MSILLTARSHKILALKPGDKIFITLEMPRCHGGWFAEVEATVQAAEYFWPKQSQNERNLGEWYGGWYLELDVTKSDLGPGHLGYVELKQIQDKVRNIIVLERS